MDILHSVFLLSSKKINHLYDIIIMQVVGFLFISLTLLTWLKEQFILADTGAKGRLNEKEVLNMLRQLNVRIPETIVKQKFKVSIDHQNNHDNLSFELPE